MSEWDDIEEFSRLPQLEGRKKRSVEHLGDYNRMKTHCAHGHPFDEKNTRLVRRSDGYVARHCRKCHSQRCIKSRKKQWDLNRDQYRARTRESMRRLRAKLKEAKERELLAQLKAKYEGGK